MFPYEIKPIEGSIGEELKELFKGDIKSGFVEVGPKKWVFPSEYEKHAEKYYNLELREDDLWIMTYPRSGTTWMQEILWLINNNLDYETASKEPLIERFPFLELNMMLNKEFADTLMELNRDDPEALEVVENLKTPGYVIADEAKSPRHIKTHFPPSLVPPNLVDTCKVVYVARNPFDVAVSFYHHNRLLKAHDYCGDFEKYWELFEQNLIVYTPYWEHLKEAWALKDHPNFLFLFYEDLLRDLPSNLKKIGTFLNKELTDEEIEKLVNHVQIDNFRKNVPFLWRTNPKGMVNPSEQGFIRRGKIGGNKEFDDKIKLRADEWFKENLAKTDIEFPEF